MVFLNLSAAVSPTLREKLQGLGLGVWDFGFWVSGFGFRVQGLGSRGLGFRVLGFWVLGFRGFRV